MKEWKLVVSGAGIALAGIALGASLFGASGARAQHTYTECFFGRQESVDVSAAGVVTWPDASHTIHVPSGWEVVAGGGSGGDSGAILLCR